MEKNHKHNPAEFCGHFLVNDRKRGGRASEREREMKQLNINTLPNCQPWNADLQMSNTHCL